MTSDVVTRRSFRAEREFGLIVGGVVVLLASRWLYLGRFTSAAPAILVVGVLLMGAGVLFPQALVLPNEAWMRLAVALSNVTSPVILGIIFFGVLTPIGVIKRVFGWDPLYRRAPQRDSYWHPYSQRQRNRRHYEKMF